MMTGFLPTPITSLSSHGSSSPCHGSREASRDVAGLPLVSSDSDGIYWNGSGLEQPIFVGILIRHSLAEGRKLCYRTQAATRLPFPVIALLCFHQLYQEASAADADALQLNMHHTENWACYIPVDICRNILRLSLAISLGSATKVIFFLLCTRVWTELTKHLIHVYAGYVFRKSDCTWNRTFFFFFLTWSYNLFRKSKYRFYFLIFSLSPTGYDILCVNSN